MREKKSVIIWCFLFFLCIFFLNNCGSDSTVQPVITPTPSTYTVNGVITNSQSQPVGGVNCALSNYGTSITESAIYTTQTDSNGNYSFSGIPSGRYKLVISKDGYVKINTIFSPSDLTSVKNTLNIIMISINEWPSVMGSYPYDPAKGYIMVSTRDYEVNPSGDARNDEMSGHDASNAGVSVEVISNKDGAPVAYGDKGCLHGNGTVDWNAEVTYEKGITHFYNVKIGETCTVSAQKTDHEFLTETDAVAVAGEMNHYILVGGIGGKVGTETPTPTPALTAMSDSAFQKQNLYNQDGSLKSNPVIDAGTINIHGSNYIRKKLSHDDSITFNGTNYPVYGSIPEIMTVKHAYTTADAGEYFDPVMSGLVDGYMASGKINNGKESVKSGETTVSAWDPNEKVYLVNNESGFEYYLPYLPGITDNVALVTDYVNGQGSSVGVNHMFPFGWAFDSKFITFNIDWQGVDSSYNGGVGSVINVKSNIKNYIIETANLDPNTEISKITKGNSDNCSYCPDPARWLTKGVFMPIAPVPGFQRNLLRKYTRAGTWILNTHTSDLFVRRDKGGVELPVYDNSNIYPLVIQTWENQNYTLLNKTDSLVSGVITSYPGNEAYYTNNVFFQNSAGVITVANNYFIQGIGGLTSRETDGWLGFKGDSPMQTMQWDKGENNADYGGQANKPYMFGGSNSSKSSGTKYSCNLKHSNSFLVNRVAKNKIKDKMYSVHYYADIGDGKGYQEVFYISYEWKALDVDKTTCKWKAATDGKGTWVPKAVLMMKNGENPVNPFVGPGGTDIHVIRFKATGWSGTNVVAWGATSDQFTVKENVENGEIYTYVASGSSNNPAVKFLLVLTN
ncbi:MAG TPA: carboxypeptidase-like regulatory domain-containing protein [Candidatus Eremiobacteraeota bacterium]|nr:carboxypeptidase-like regulatory domain-containing protein [Candidatus Eremiobacteraeota bacterium]